MSFGLLVHLKRLTVSESHQGPCFKFETRKPQKRAKTSSVQVNFLPEIFGKNKSANARRLGICGKTSYSVALAWSALRGSNSRHSAWEADTLPTELNAHECLIILFQPYILVKHPQPPYPRTAHCTILHFQGLCATNRVIFCTKN